MQAPLDHDRRRTQHGHAGPELQQSLQGLRRSFPLKANNGIYLIDDFGRQNKATPTEILNRWIVPMERHIDYLSFQAGGKMTVPFEAFLIFSTNLRPDSLGAEAFLRWIQCKMFLRSPKAPEFIQIFERVCASRQILFPKGLPE